MVLLMSLINLLLKKKLNCLLLLLQKKKFKLIYKIKNNFKKGITPLLCALTVFNFCAINVSAANYSVYYPFNEPFISDTTGYFVVVSDTNDWILMWSFNYDTTYPEYSGDSVNGGGNIINEPNYVTFYEEDTRISLKYSMGTSGYFTIFSWQKSTGHLDLYHNNYVPRDELGDVQTVSLTFGQPIRALYVKGHYMFESTSNDISHNVTATFGKDSSINVLFEKLNEMYLKLYTIDNNQISLINQSNAYLKDLVDKFNINSDVTISDVSSSGITSVENKENALVGSNASTSELSVDINPLASSVVWNLVDNVVTGNAKVFTMFISILTIAVIGLILNR